MMDNLKGTKGVFISSLNTAAYFNLCKSLGLQDEKEETDILAHAVLDVKNVYTCAL